MRLFYRNDDVSKIKYRTTMILLPHLSAENQDRSGRCVNVPYVVCTDLLIGQTVEEIRNRNTKEQRPRK